jgi:hypothetical protein
MSAVVVGTLPPQVTAVAAFLRKRSGLTLAARALAKSC